MKRESGIVYEVKKVHDKEFVILSSEDGSCTALISMKGLDLYFGPICPRLRED